MRAEIASGSWGYQPPPAECSCGRWTTQAIDPTEVQGGYAGHLVADRLADEQYAEREQQLRLPLTELATVARSWVALHTAALDRVEADVDPEDFGYLVLPDTTHEDIERLSELLGEISEVVDRLSRRPCLAPYAAQLTAAADVVQHGELALTDVVPAMPGYGTGSRR